MNRPLCSRIFAQPKLFRRSIVVIKLVANMEHAYASIVVIKMVARSSIWWSRSLVFPYVLFKRSAAQFSFHFPELRYANRTSDSLKMATADQLTELS